MNNGKECGIMISSIKEKVKTVVNEIKTMRRIYDEGKVKSRAENKRWHRINSWKHLYNTMPRIVLLKYEFFLLSLFAFILGIVNVYLVYKHNFFGIGALVMIDLYPILLGYFTTKFGKKMFIPFLGFLAISLLAYNTFLLVPLEFGIIGMPISVFLPQFNPYVIYEMFAFYIGSWILIRKE